MWIIKGKDTRSFSGSYSTDFNNSCGKFDLIAARSLIYIYI